MSGPVRRTALQDARSTTSPSPRAMPHLRRAVKRAALAFALAPIIVVILAACGGTESGQPTQNTAGGDQALRTQVVTVEGGRSYVNVGAASLAAMLKAKDFPLINVHVPYEGEIAGTDVFIPYDQIAQILDKLPADKSAKVVLYCRSGSMSAIAARTLIKLGYTNVWNLDGGMIGWEQAGYSLVKTR